jgi:hydroxymethylpyrimidine/phosphomethylpyrimidine kinase
VLDIGQSQDWLALQMALAPCLLGYAAVSKMLRDHPQTKKEGNPYWPWIENYNAADYLEAVRLGSGMTGKRNTCPRPLLAPL